MPNLMQTYNGVAHTYIKQRARIFDQFCLIFVNGRERMIRKRETELYKDIGEEYNGMREKERQ